MLSPSTLANDPLHPRLEMAIQAKTLEEKFFTKNPGVKFVRLQWVDFSGVLRTRFITKTRCMQLAIGTNHYSLGQNCMIVPISTAPQCFHDGPEAWELCPDWQTVKVCGFAPEHASVMCFNSHLGSPTTLPGVPGNCCPRCSMTSKTNTNRNY
jgi:glutamine synthetase